MITRLTYEWQERAAIIEFDGGFDRETAERMASEQMGLHSRQMEMEMPNAGSHRQEESGQ